MAGVTSKIASSRVPRLIARIRRDGVARASLAAVQQVASVRTQLLLEHRHDFDLPFQIVANGLLFAEADFDDLVRYQTLRLVKTDRDRRVAAERLGRGDKCIVGLLDDFPVTYLWCTSVVRELPGRPLALAPGSVFIYKTFTLPEWRGRGLNRAALSWALQYCYGHGIRTAFIDVAESNSSSLRAIRAVGFRVIGRFRVITAGPLAYTAMAADLQRRVCHAAGGGGEAAAWIKR